MFLLLAAPSAPAEFTALHVSSWGGCHGNQGELPRSAGTRSPGSCGSRTPQPGGGARQEYPARMAPTQGTQHGATLGQRSGEGARGPRCSASPICSLRCSPGTASSSRSWRCAGGASNNTPTAQALTAPSLPHHLPRSANGSRSCLGFAQFPRHVLVTCGATRVPCRGCAALPYASFLHRGLAWPDRQWGSGRAH